jgi:tRNA nucleotidyltransferase/poly(A) polymerase
LEFLRNYYETVIVGGYLRDEILNLTANDVDFKTNISSDKLKKIIPYAKEREAINGMVVYNFKKNNFDYEILPITENLKTYNGFGDLTINSLMYDGIQLIDRVNGLKDIQNKILRPVDYSLYVQNFHSSPPLFLKTIRLLSTTGFTPTVELLEILKKEFYILNSISEQIIINEGYKVLEGKHTLNAIRILSQIGFISTFDNNKPNEFILSKKRSNFHFYLCFYAFNTSYETIKDFISIFKFPKLIIENFEELYAAVDKNLLPSNYKLLNEKMLLESLLKK